MIKNLKKAKLLLRSYPYEFVKMVENPIGTTEEQKITYMKRTSLEVERKKIMARTTMFDRRQTADG
jgi:hypothetical protein